MQYIRLEVFLTCYASLTIWWHKKLLAINQLPPPLSQTHTHTHTHAQLFTALCVFAGWHDRCHSRNTSFLLLCLVLTEPELRSCSISWLIDWPSPKSKAIFQLSLSRPLSVSLPLSGLVDHQYNSCIYPVTYIQTAAATFNWLLPTKKKRKQNAQKMKKKQHLVVVCFTTLSNCLS